MCFRRYLLNIPLWLHIVLVTAIVTIVLTQFVFFNSPEWFSGGARLSDIAYNLSLAYVVSYVFFIVVSFPQQRDKWLLSQFWLGRLGALVSKRDRFRNHLRQAAQSNGDITVTYEDFETMCSRICTADRAPLYISGQGPATWGHYLSSVVSESQEIIDSTLNAVMYSDAGVTIAMTNVRDCMFFELGRTVIPGFFVNGPHTSRLDEFAKPIWEYFQLIDALEQVAQNWRTDGRN